MQLKRLEDEIAINCEGCGKMLAMHAFVFITKEGYHHLCFSCSDKWRKENPDELGGGDQWQDLPKLPPFGTPVWVISEQGEEKKERSVSPASLKMCNKWLNCIDWEIIDEARCKIISWMPREVQPFPKIPGRLKI